MVQRFIHGERINPQTVNHGWESGRLAQLRRGTESMRLLAISESLPKPRSPATNTIINLRF
jgi:hypothetical protein